MTDEYALSPSEIQALRLGLGFTQAQFAQLLKVSIRSVQYWESGRMHPDVYQSATLLQLKTRYERAFNDGRRQQFSLELQELFGKVALGVGIGALLYFLFREER
jgi:transcriptional regulator with XRE-family HTH domain